MASRKGMNPNGSRLRGRAEVVWLTARVSTKSWPGFLNHFTLPTGRWRDRRDARRVYRLQLQLLQTADETAAACRGPRIPFAAP